MVEAYSLAMKKGVASELYLIGSQNIYTMKQCIDSLIGLSTKAGEISYEVDPKRVRPTELKTFIGDFKKFHDLTGWEPKIKFEETMKSVLNYWRDFIDKGYY